MMRLPRYSFALALLPAVALLGSCGGGDGGGAIAPAPPATGPNTTYVQGQFAPEASFAALCVTPRTGTDPVSHQAYPDSQGTLLDELNWLRSWTNDLYLWFSEVPDPNPATFSTDAAYFDVLKTPAVTASGAKKDKFHFTYTTAQWEALSQSGVSPGYGLTIVVLAAAPPRDFVIGFTEPGSPAAAASANIGRGAQILAIDGADLVNANDQASINTLNAGLSPTAAGQSHTFSILDAGASAPRTVTLVSAKVTETPVANVQTISAPSGALVGYILFNDHLATAEGELVSAFTKLQTAGVTDLVLDIRYNGGGYLDIASEVAYMIAGPNRTIGQTFELTEFSSKHATVDPVTMKTIVPLGFHTTTQGFGGTPAGQALPTLNLARVFVLTGPSTCSASESIINSLNGVNVQVLQVGTTTCGKPYGFYPTDNCGTTYFSIQFQGVNAQGFGAYPDGFTPMNTMAIQGYKIPGCSVADDFGHALGDSSEGLLSSALSYQSTGVCPVPPSAIAPGGQAIKSLWRQNRIQRRPGAP